MESFVARHVLIMFVHNGDMDANGGPSLENENIIEEAELGDDAEEEEEDGIINVGTTHSVHTT